MTSQASPFDDVTLQQIIDAEPDAQVLILPVADNLAITHTNEAAQHLIGEALPNMGSISWACHDVWDSGSAQTLTDVFWPGQDHKWFDVRVRRVYGRLCLTFADVTRRHEVMDALLDSQCRYRLLAENAGDVVFQVRGRRLEWISTSVTEVLGWDQADVVGRRVIELVHPDDREGVIKASRLTAGSTVFEARFHHRDRSWVWLSVEMRAAQDLGGDVARVGSCRVMQGM